MQVHSQCSIDGPWGFTFIQVAFPIYLTKTFDGEFRGMGNSYKKANTQKERHSSPNYQSHTKRSPSLLWFLLTKESPTNPWVCLTYNGPRSQFRKSSQASKTIHQIKATKVNYMSSSTRIHVVKSDLSTWPMAYKQPCIPTCIKKCNKNFF